MVRTILVAATVLAASLIVVSAVFAQPQIPATFYGSVTVDGQPAEAGTEVRGFVGGIDCTQAAPGERPVIRDGATSAYVLYVVHESQRAGCARDGSIVTFTIGGRVAAQSAPWKPGPNRLDVSAGSGTPIPLPSATGTIAAAITNLSTTTALPSPSPSLARPTGTPPTDDIRFDGTVPANATPGTSPATDEGGGSPVLAGVILVVGALAALSGGLGIYLAGRPRRGSNDDEA